MSDLEIDLAPSTSMRFWKILPPKATVKKVEHSKATPE